MLVIDRLLLILAFKASLLLFDHRLQTHTANWRQFCTISIDENPVKFQCVSKSKCQMNQVSVVNTAEVSTTTDSPVSPKKVTILRTRNKVIFSKLAMRKQSSFPSPRPSKSQPGFAAKQYNTLMNWFKRQVTLTDTETDELAVETGLSPFQITFWFQKQQRLMRSTTVNKILQSLSRNWHFSWLIYLEQCYRQSVTIASVEAADLSHRWNTTDEVIFGWFRQRRLYELFKFQGVHQTVAEEHKGIRDILEANDLNAMAAALSNAEVSSFVDPDSLPSVIVRRCSPLVGRYELVQNEDSSPERPKKIGPGSSPEEPNKIRRRMRFTPEQRAFLRDRFAISEYMSTKEAEDIAVNKFSGTVHRKSVLIWFMNTRWQKKLAAKMKPPTSSNQNGLASALKAPLSSNLGGKMELDSDVSKRSGKPSINKSKFYSQFQLQMLFATFKSFPHPSPSCIAELSSRANLTQMQVRWWFGAMHRKLSFISDSILQHSYRNEGLMDEQVKALEAEFQKHQFESAATRETLARQLKLGKGPIRHWFHLRRFYELKLSTIRTSNSSAHADPCNSSVAAESDASTGYPNVELDPFGGRQVVTEGSDDYKNAVDAEIMKVDGARGCADVIADFSNNYIEAKTCDSVCIQPGKQPKYSVSETMGRISTECCGVGENFCSLPEMKIDSQFSGQNAETHRKTSTLSELSASNAGLINTCASTAAKSILEFPEKLARPDKSTPASRTTVKPNVEEKSDYQLKLSADSAEFLLNDFGLAAQDAPSQYPELQVDYLLKLLADDIDREALSPESQTEATSVRKAEQSTVNPLKPTEVSPAKPAEVSPAKHAEVSPAKPAKVSPAKRAEVSPAKPAEVSLAKLAEVSPAKPAEVSLAKLAEVSPAKPTRMKKKIHYSTLQVRILQQEFKKSRFPSSSKIRTLSHALNLTARQIESWFQERRFKRLASLGSPKEKSEQETSRSLIPWQRFILDQEYGRNSQLTEERVTDLCRRLRTSRQPIVTWFMERNEGDKTST